MPKRLLLIEDNADDEALILRALRKSDLAPRVQVARDGLEALAWLDQLRAHPGGRAWPDVVLLDLNLPKVSGLEVLRQIRADEETRRLPVVVLTSSRDERDVAASYELGASSYVHKPISSEGFTEAIRLLGTYWLSLNESADDPAGDGAR
jgi:two-component system response regulator